MSDSEELDLVNENKYRDTDEMMHEYKLKQLREKKQRLSLRREQRLAKKQQRDELRLERKEISNLKREQFRERTKPLESMMKKVGSGMTRAGQGFAHSMAKKPVNRGSSMPQPRGMFGQGSSGMLSMGGGSSQFDFTLGRGKESPFTFGKSKGGMSLSLLGSSHSQGSRKKRRRKR